MTRREPIDDTIRDEYARELECDTTRHDTETIVSHVPNLYVAAPSGPFSFASFATAEDSSEVHIPLILSTLKRIIEIEEIEIE